MKKLLIFICLFFASFVAMSQAIQPRTSTTTPLDSNLIVGKFFRPPVFADTTQANLFRTIDSSARIIYTYDIQGYWYKSTSPKQWKRLVDTSILSTIYYVDSSIAINNFYNGFDSSTRLISGAVIWDSNFTYENNFLVYQILGHRYTAPPSSFNSNGSDTLYDRYITVVADTNGVVSVLEGVAGSPANIPAPDPASQITLAVYFIPANSTQPAVVQASVIYKENIAPPEWAFDAGTSSANPNYPTNPYEGVKSTRLSSIVATQSFSYQELGTHIPDTYSYLSLKLRLDDTLPQSVGFVFTWYDVASAVSLPITVINGYYGYNRAITGAYQTIIIPMSSFPFITNVFDKLQISVVGNASVGVQIDNIILQTGGINITNGTTIDTTSLSNRINQKLNIIDTAGMRLRPIAGTNMAIDVTNYPDVVFASRQSVGAVMYPLRADSIGVDTTLEYISPLFLDTTRQSYIRTYATPDSVYQVFVHWNGTLDSTLRGGGSGAATRFGIEDNLGLQDRIVDFQSLYKLDLQNVSEFDVNGGSTGVDGYSGIYMSPVNGQSSLYSGSADYGFQIDMRKSDSSIFMRSSNSTLNTSNTIKLTPSDIVFTKLYGVTPFDIIMPQVDNNRYIPLSVNGNYADATGNITISSGGTITHAVDSIYTLTDSLLLVHTSPYNRTDTFSWRGSGGSSNSVDTIYRTLGVDSIKFTIGGRYYAIKDSTGGSAVVKQTHTSGTSISLNNATTWLNVDPASILASLAITLPASPIDGQDVLVTFGGTITSGGVVTSVSFSPTPIDASTPSYVMAGEHIGYRWNATNSKWYRTN